MGLTVLGIVLLVLTGCIIGGFAVYNKAYWKGFNDCKKLLKGKSK